MKPENQIIELAKLDGWTFNKSKHGHWLIHSPSGELHEPAFNRPKFDSSTGEKIIIEPLDGCCGLIPEYTSRDVIVPLIEKQGKEIGEQVIINLADKLGIDSDWSEIEASLKILLTTPQQLCEALLRACGKWEE